MSNAIPSSFGSFGPVIFQVPAQTVIMRAIKAIWRARNDLLLFVKSAKAATLPPAANNLLPQSAIVLPNLGENWRFEEFAGLLLLQAERVSCGQLAIEN